MTTLSERFYLPAAPAYSIVDSASDSVRFTVDRTLRRCECGHLASLSSFVDPEGGVMGWHDFGLLEGPGWAANAVGGAWEIWRLGGFLGKPDWQAQALAVLDHVLEHGFIDTRTGLISGYRETTTGRLCLNYKHQSDWFCPGSMAKVGCQVLGFAADLGADPRAARMRQAALRCADWIDRHLEPVPNGWFPRRCTPTGTLYRRSPDGGEDPFWQGSADGLYIVQLQLALTASGLADWRDQAARALRVFVALGGVLGSINHDTYDARENVAFSVAFRTLLAASRLFGEEDLRQFAYEACLHGLERFQMCADRNGVATTGLLYMEDSWDTAYLWENAEAALACFEAALDLRPVDPNASRDCELRGLTILRACARHHHGPHGFLTEGVDWNNHVGRQHHIGQAEFGAIQYTEPFLNNQHIVEPTLFYLEHLASRDLGAGHAVWTDSEGNRLVSLPGIPSAGE
jgi:hypothetical protein